MRQYEMMIILDPEVDERNLNKALEKLLAVVPAEGGKLDKVDVMGRRRLAYEINKKTEGIYVVVYMSVEPRYRARARSPARAERNSDAYEVAAL